MLSRIVKGSLIIVFTTILTTLVINAGDNVNSLKDSLLGNVIVGIFSEKVPEKEPCPRDMVFVDTDTSGFCIDKYEASPSRECFYADPKNQEETRLNLEKKGCVPVTVEGAVPWRNIAQHQAVLACGKAGKRLPSAEEWYRGALGTPDSESVCNIGNIRQQYPKRSENFSECVSFAGAYDMIGNVWEWVDESVENGNYHDRILPNEGYVAGVDINGVPTETSSTPDQNFNNDYFWSNSSGTQGMFRGGYWGLSERVGLYSIHAGIKPSFVGIGVGFRCAK